MERDILYTCYAFIAINHAHNLYPIKQAEKHITSLLTLREGDLMYIKGIGNLMVKEKYIYNYDYKQEGKEGLYQEIGIDCVMVQ